VGKRDLPRSVTELTRLQTARENLVRILQNAYSGEVAAAYAYRGHWRSLKDSPEKERIKKIEAEEWHHRTRVGRWLVPFSCWRLIVRSLQFFFEGRLMRLCRPMSGKASPFRPILKIYEAPPPVRRRSRGKY
jgi:hypothetical protein